MRGMITKRRAAFGIGAALTVLAVFSCPQAMNEEFVTQVAQDIAAAVAPPRTLTVSGDGNGVVSPSGSVEVKEGVAFGINATAFSSHVFRRWSKKSGSGDAVFANASAAETTVVVRGGNAEILAEFEARPTVFYTTPTGTGIYTNTKIFVYFSKAMKKESVESAGMITVMKGGSTAVSGTIVLISSNVARFTPSAYLSPQQYHIVRVDKAVTDASGIAMASDYSGTFRTASTADTEPPTAPSFKINTGTPTHVGVQAISLTDVAAVDGGEVVEALIQENGGALQSFAFTPTIAYELSAGDGAKTIRLYAVDSVGNTSTEYAERTVVLDTVAPSGSFVINNSSNGAADYVNSTSVILASGITDAGTSMTGAQMQYSTDGGGTWSTWEAYNAAKSATLGTGDGTKTVKLRVKDLVDNTAVFEDTIVYDATAPTFSTFVLNSGAAYSTTPYLSAALSASDATSGVNEMAFSTDGGSSWGSWKAYAAADTVLFGSQGTASISAKVRDRAGNEATLNDGIFVDTAAPTISAFSVDAGATYALTTSVTLSQTAADPNGASGSGLQSMRFSNNGTTWSDWEAYSASKAWALVSGDGLKTASIQVRDVAGNVGSNSDGITLDTAAPVIGSFIVLGTGDGTNAYTKNTSVTLMNSVTDAAGTPIEMRFSNDGSTWTGWTAYSGNYLHTLTSGEGAKTVYCQFRDAADPATHVAAGSDGITLDQTNPTVSVTAPANGASVFGNVSCAANASDALSGVWKVEFFGNGSSVGTDTDSPYTAPSPWAVHALTEDSSYPALAVAYDRAGNTTTSTTNTVTIDNWSATLVTLPPSSFSGSVTAIAASSDLSTLIIAYNNQSTSSVYVIRSTDGGANWGSPTLLGSGTRPDLVMDQSGILHAVYIFNNTLYQRLSNDNGATWQSSTQITSDANSAYAPVIAAYGNYAQIFYVMTSGYLGHYFSANGGMSWTQTAPISGTVFTSVDAVGGPQGIHIAYRTNSTQMYHGRYNFGGSPDIAPRQVATMASSGGVSIALHPDDPLKAVIPYASSAGGLYDQYTSDGGNSWNAASVISSFPNAFPAATLKQGQSGSPLYYIACNNYNASMLRVSKSSDGATWYSYDVASAGNATRPSAIGDDQFMYIAYYDTADSRLKFAKVKVNF